MLKQGHDTRLRGNIRLAETDLSDPVIREFATRRGLEAPAKEPKPKARTR